MSATPPHEQGGFSGQQNYTPPQGSPPRRRFSSSQLTAIIIIGIIFGSCALCGVVGGIAEYLNPSNPNANSPISNSSQPITANQNGESTERVTNRYFDGGRACQFLASVNGLNLGNYTKYTNTEGYTCSDGKRLIKLSCSPVSDALCNEVSYSIDGEEQGATSAELYYSGTSLHAESHRRDIQTFIQYCNQLARQALGAEINAEMRQYIQNTSRFLPMRPEPDRDTLERHTMKRNLGSGFVKILTRRNDLPGGPAYFIFFTVYPDEHWIDR